MMRATQPGIPLPDAIWNPIQSASAATTFSAFLSGIVLSAMVQIGISQAKSGIDRAHSLRFSSISLVTLLAATYMFVLLAGVAPMSDALEVRLRVVSKAGLLFAIGGSVLAVGAVLTLALMLLVFIESHDQARGPIAIEAVKAALILGAVTAGIFLIFGYDDIYRMAAGGADLPWNMWVVMLLLVYSPGYLVLYAPRISCWARPRVTRIFTASKQRWFVRPAVLAACWLFLLPTLAYLVVSHVVDSVGTTLVAAVTTACSAWAGISMASLLVVAMASRPPARPNSSASP